MNILAIDLSTSTSGVSYFVDGKLCSMLYFKLNKKLDFWGKIFTLRDMVVIGSIIFPKVKYVVIEEPKQSYAKGRTGMTMLYGFNLIVQFLFKDNGFTVETLREVSARKHLGIPGFSAKLKNQFPDMNTKKFVYSKAILLEELKDRPYLHRRTRMGNIRQECFDMIDSYIIGKYASYLAD